MQNMLKASFKKIILLVIVSMLVFPVAFAAGNTETVTFVEAGTNAPLDHVRMLVYTCTDNQGQCNNVIQPPVIDRNSGTTNIIDNIEFPGTPNPTDYARYVYKNGYLPQAFVINDDFGFGNHFNIQKELNKKEQCTAPMSNILTTPVIQEGQTASLSATVQSAFSLSLEPPFFIPAGFEDFYATETDVTLTVRDSNGAIVLTQQTTQPLNIAADDALTVSFQNIQLPPGTYEFELKTNVVDNQCVASSVIEQIEIRTIKVNSNPTITITPATSFTVNEGEPVTFTITATDSDGDTVTISQPSFPSGAALDAQGVFTWTPDFTQAGTYTLTFDAHDGNGGTATAQVFITVINRNREPVITSLPPTDATEDIPYTYTIAANDPDNDPLTFSFVDTPPVGMNIDSATGLIEWTPTNDNVGENMISIQVSDGSLTAGQVFTITVSNINDAPEFTTTPNTDATQDTLYTYSIGVRDVDVGDTITLSLAQAPAGMTLMQTAQGPQLSWTPTANQVGTADVTLSATDNTATTEQSFTIIVADKNDNPVITSSAPTTAIEDTLYTTTITATDPEQAPNELTFTLRSGPVGMAINPTTGTITWTPNNLQVGNNAVEVEVLDGFGGSATQSFTITVANNPPILTNPGTQQAAEDNLFTLDLSSTDEGEGLTYTLELTATPSGMVIDETIGEITWTPDNSQVGTNTVIIIVNDGNGGTDTTSFDIIVANSNDLPIITTQPIRTATEDVLYTYDVDATDEDGDTLTFDLTDRPAGMIINPTTGLIQWTPDNSQVGNHLVGVQVFDGTGLVLQTFTISVANSNDAPVITSTPITTATQNTLYTYDVDATDEDGDTLAFSFGAVPPAGMNIDAATGIIDWVPTNEQVGSNTILVQVTDGIEFDSQTFTITVIDVNDPPTIKTVGDETINEGELFQFIIETSDPDGDPVTLTISNLPPGATVDQQQVFTWTPTFTQAGTYNIIFSADDGRGGVTTVTDTITVLQVNSFPEAVAGDDRVANVNDILTFDGSASSDADGTIVSHTWDFGDGSITQGAVVTHQYLSAGEFSVTLTVEDNDGLVATDSLSVIINGPPTTQLFCPAIGTIFRPLLIDASGTMDESAVSFVFDFGDGEIFTTTSPMVMHEFTTAGTFIVRATAEDVQGLTASATCTIEISIDAPPIDFFASPEQPTIGDNILFIANDIDNEAVSFLWDFGDPTSIGNTEDGVTAFHTYNQAGTYLVTLTIMDDRGVMGTIQKAITVAVPRSTAERERIVFSGINVDDIVTTDGEVPIRIRIDNDGTSRLNDVRLTVMIYDLDIRQTLGPFDIGTEQEISKQMRLFLPDDTEPGQYDIEIRLSNDNSERVTYRTITIV
jgi:hypothetical protein